MPTLKRNPSYYLMLVLSKENWLNEILCTIHLTRRDYYAQNKVVKPFPS